MVITSDRKDAKKKMGAATRARSIYEENREKHIEFQEN
jgi:hypothetical protein